MESTGGTACSGTPYNINQDSLLIREKPHGRASMVACLHSGDMVPVLKCYQAEEGGTIWAKVPSGVTLDCGVDDHGQRAHIVTHRHGYVPIQDPHGGRTMHKVKGDLRAPSKSMARTEMQVSNILDLYAVAGQPRWLSLAMRMMLSGPFALCLGRPPGIPSMTPCKVATGDGIDIDCDADFARQSTITAFGCQEVPWERLKTEENSRECKIQDQSINPRFKRQSTPAPQAGNSSSSTTDPDDEFDSTDELESPLEAKPLVRQRTPATTKKQPANSNVSQCGAKAVEDFMAGVGLAQYTDVFLGQGFDEMETLFHMEESHMIQLGVLPGHALKLKQKIAARRGD